MDKRGLSHHSANAHSLSYEAMEFRNLEENFYDNQMFWCVRGICMALAESVQSRSTMAGQTSVTLHFHRREAKIMQVTYFSYHLFPKCNKTHILNREHAQHKNMSKNLNPQTSNLKQVHYLIHMLHLKYRSESIGSTSTPPAGQYTSFKLKNRAPEL